MSRKAGSPTPARAPASPSTPGPTPTTCSPSRSARSGPRWCGSPGSSRVGATAMSAMARSRPRSWPATPTRCAASSTATCTSTPRWCGCSASDRRGAAAIDAVFFGNRADTPPYVPHPDDPRRPPPRIAPDGLGDVGADFPSSTPRRPRPTRSRRSARPHGLRRRAGGAGARDGPARAALLQRPRGHQLEHRRRADGLAQLTGASIRT